MKNYKILNLILSAAVKALQDIDLTCTETAVEKCSGFLCPKDGTCKVTSVGLFLAQHQYHNIITAVTHIFFCVGNSDELSKLYLPIIDKIPSWAHCFDRRHVSIS